MTNQPRRQSPLTTPQKSAASCGATPPFGSPGVWVSADYMAALEAENARLHETLRIVGERMDALIARLQVGRDSRGSMNQLALLHGAIAQVKAQAGQGREFEDKYHFLYQILYRITLNGYVPDEAFKKIVEQARMETLSE